MWRDARWNVARLRGVAECGRHTRAAIENQQRSGDGEQSSGGTAAQKSAPRTPWHGGIVADNLERVSATVEQILEVLNRDAGLMVEMKHAIAQDAGESGQILEESDLSDSAVTERLREDLRTVYGIVVGGGQATLADKIFRIGHMGYIGEKEVLYTLASLGKVLREQGFPARTDEALKAFVDAMSTQAPAKAMSS